MTHYQVLVIGDTEQVAAQLAPYDESLPVDPYFSPIEAHQLAAMRAHYRLPDGCEPDRYLPHVQDWTGYPGATIGGVVGAMRTSNPLSRWDYWRYTQLPVRGGGHADNVTRGELDVARLDAGADTLDAPLQVPLHVQAVLADGVWRAPGLIGWFGSTTATAADQARFAQWYATFWQAMPDQTRFSVADCHI